MTQPPSATSDSKQSLEKLLEPAKRSVNSLRYCLLLVLLVAVAYYPAIRNGFVNYDDDAYVTANEHVLKGFSVKGVVWAFQSTAAANWHPLTWISHMADCELFGLNPSGHHLTSVLFHACNTVLVFLVLRGMTGYSGASLVIALLFGLHPLRVESVAWVAERKDVLSTFFWLLTLGAYTKYVSASRIHSTSPSNGTTNRPKPKLWYSATLGCLSLGLLSKPMLVTTPFLLLLLDYWPFNRWKQTRTGLLILEKLPIFGLAAAASFITYSVQQNAGAVSQTLPLVARLQNAIVSYCRYLGKTIWPSDLCVCYPHPDFWPSFVAAICFLILFAVTALVLFQGRNRPYLFVGWFWYLGTLVPTIGLVQVGQQAMADRYTYFPTIGILLMLILGIRELAINRTLKPVSILPTITAAILAVFIVLTHWQIRYWKDSVSLFQRGIAVTHNNSLAHGGMARALVDMGQVNEAIDHYREAIRLRPNDTIARNGLGNLLVQKGFLNEAIAQFQEAYKLKPTEPITLNNLGISLARKGQIDEAKACLEHAIKIRPDYAEAHNNLGGVLGAKGRFEEASVHFQEVVRLQPQNAEGHNNLGLALVQLRQWDKAIAHFQEAIRLNPNFAKAQKNLALALAYRARPNLERTPESLR